MSTRTEQYKVYGNLQSIQYYDREFVSLVDDYRNQPRQKLFFYGDVNTVLSTVCGRMSYLYI